MQKFQFAQISFAMIGKRIFEKAEREGSTVIKETDEKSETIAKTKKNFWNIGNEVKSKNYKKAATFQYLNLLKVANFLLKMHFSGSSRWVKGNITNVLIAGRILTFYSNLSKWLTGKDDQKTM